VVPTALVNGVELVYQVTGSGDDLIWVMGTGMSGDAWHRFQVPHFRERYQCVTYDLRGSGQSECPNDAYSVRLLADDLVALLDYLEIDQAHFVGFSLGSATLQELTLAHPKRVRSAVFLSTWSSTRREHHIRRHFESRIYALEHATLDVFNKFAFWMWGPSTVDDRFEELQELEEFLVSVSGARDVSGYIGHFAADLAHETYQRLAAIKCPVLVAYGAEDLITRPTYNRRVADAINGAKHVEIAEAGHLAFLEKPMEVNLAIDAFLGSV
jgi:3-oxoadipate enol-lactonase